MGKRKHPKLRACGRWMVWVCTGLLIVAIQVSIWIQPAVIVQHNSAVSIDRGLMVVVENTQFKCIILGGKYMLTIRLGFLDFIRLFSRDRLSCRLCVTFDG